MPWHQLQAEPYFVHAEITILSSADNTICGPEHARYIDEVAVTARPDRIDALLQVLQLQGLEVVSPQARAGLHPLFIPLARGEAPLQGAREAAATSATVGLLRPVGRMAREMPVVSMSRDAPCVTLLARSTDEFLHRSLAEEDHRGGPGGVAGAAGSSGLYREGDAAKSPSLAAYLSTRAGRFPDVSEALALGHLEKGDAMSALITGEWYMRKAHFPGWGRPFEFNAQLFRRMHRHEEARDVARMALRMPWYTCGDFFETAAIAGLGGDYTAVKEALQEEAQMASAGSAIPIATSKDDLQVALEAAEDLMNRVTAGNEAWDTIRGPLAAKYSDVGLHEVAAFIRAA